MADHHLLLLLLSLFFAAAFACGEDLRQLSQAAQAETLIRRLNLLPADPVAEPERAGDGGGRTIVERRFGLPGLEAPDEELGHHAGYYRLPNSFAARYGLEMIFGWFWILVVSCEDWVVLVEVLIQHRRFVDIIVG